MIPMGSGIRLSVQSRLIPGDSLRAIHDNARGIGFDGIELQGFPMLDLAREAIRDGVPVSAMCSGHRGWFIDPDPEQVRACVDDVKLLLELGAELDAPLIIVPIYGRTRFLPAHCGTGRTAEEDEELWLAGLREVTDHADRVGGRLLVEAINRYQNSVSVHVADAVRFARWAASPNVRAMADVFHMNIDESDMTAALVEAGDALAYVHLADNQRFEPGTGHLDFDAIFAGLAQIGYTGWASLECNLSGEWDSTLPAAIAFLRDAIDRAYATRSVGSVAAPATTG
jgi:sugar phosphate isomerase/epimerase